jgi:hypothetical protein
VIGLNNCVLDAEWIAEKGRFLVFDVLAWQGFFPLSFLILFDKKDCQRKSQIFQKHQKQDTKKRKEKVSGHESSASRK